MSTIFMETPRLILRQWELSDHEPYSQLNADEEVMEFFPSIHSSEESVAQIGRLSKHIDEYGYGFFAVERKDSHQFIGFTGLSHPRLKATYTMCRSRLALKQGKLESGLCNRGSPGMPSVWI